MISFFSFYELFPGFTYANNTRNLVNSWFGVKILILFLSSDGVGGLLTISSLLTYIRRLSSVLFSDSYF